MTLKPSIQAQLLLRELLARQDVIFWPARDPGEACWPHRWSLLWEYHERGLPWRAAGSKQAERALAELNDAGLVRTLSPRLKQLRFILTAAGDLLARSLADVNSWDDGPCTVREIHRLRNHPEASDEGGETPWIPETLLNDGRGWGDGCANELLRIAAWAMPALVNGSIETNCDSLRHVYFRLTEAGLAVAKKKGRRPARRLLPKPLRAGGDVYEVSFGRRFATPRGDSPAICC